MVGLATVRKVTAACLCTCLIACGLLALYHRATHPHTLDARGRLTHPLTVAELAAVHTPGDQPFARPAAPRDADHATCPLHLAPGAWTTEDGHERVTCATLCRSPRVTSSNLLVTFALYHLAPKTSPPVAC